MNKLFKRSLIFILLFLITIPIGFAEKESVKFISFEKAVEKTIANSDTLETIDEKILLAKRNLKSAKIKADNAEVKGITSDSKLLNNGKEKFLNPSKKKKKLVELEEEKMDLEKDLRLEVLEIYTKMRHKKSEMSTQKELLESLEIEYNNKKNEYNLGYITETQLLGYENAVSDLKLKINKAKREYDELKIEFNQMIGNPLEADIFLLDDIDLSIEEIDYNITSLVQKAKENSPVVRDARNEFLINELEEDVIRRYSRYNKPDGYDNLKETVKELEEDYKNSKETAQVNLWTDYLNLLNAKDDVEIAKLAYELAVKEKEISKLKYDNEMIIYLEYKNDIDNTEELFNDLQEKKLDLYIQKAQFDHYLKKLDYSFDSILL